jgi:hypothetical protein
MNPLLDFTHAMLQEVVEKMIEHCGAGNHVFLPEVQGVSPQPLPSRNSSMFLYSAVPVQPGWGRLELPLLMELQYNIFNID